MQKLLVLILTLFGFSNSLLSQTLSDRQQAEEVIQTYFDGWATGDSTKVGRAMHRTCHLKNFRDGKFIDLNRTQYLSGFRLRQRPAGLITRIVSMDITAGIGAAKTEIVTERDTFTDYFNLMKIDQQWFIVDKIATRIPHLTVPDLSEPIKETNITGLTKAQINKAAEMKIDSLFASYNSFTPGVAVAIVKDGKLIYKKGYGMANLNDNVPITTQTVFDIASVSKQFTAFAIYLLENEGKISLEDEVKKYIPELPAYASTIKIKHLLAHTSGLRDYGALTSIAGYYITDITTTAQLLKMMNKQRGLVFTPGTTYKYCNAGYVLLAEIVQRTTGKTFAAYTNEKMFTPLGMTNTLFCDDYQLVIKNKAESYEKIKDKYYHRPSLSTTPGPSGLLTTVEDLAKWALNFEKLVVGNKKLIDRFNEVSYLDNGRKVFVRMDEGDSIFYAKGQFVTNYRGVKRIGHGGHTAGFRTFLGRFPDQRLSIIHLSNDEHNEDLGGRYDIADYYIKESFLQKKTMASTVPTTTRNTTTKAASNFSIQLTEYAGTYFSDELDTRYYFEVINNQLVMKHIRLDDIALQRKGENSFTGSGPNTFFFEINFTRNTSGNVSGFEISNWGVTNLKFVKQN